jgi:hypothetical protein
VPRMSKGQISRTKEPDVIAVPVALCKLLMSEPSDYKDPAKYEQVNGMSKALLKVLVEMQNK